MVNVGYGFGNIMNLCKRFLRDYNFFVINGLNLRKRLLRKLRII